MSKWKDVREEFLSEPEVKAEYDKLPDINQYVKDGKHLASDIHQKDAHHDYLKDPGRKIPYLSADSGN
jgi:hypothetical protein